MSLRKLRSSSYSFEDFLARLQRSQQGDVSRLYVENKVLFENREDMLQRAVQQLTWEKATVLVSTAYYHQPLSTDSFRYLLATMLRHNVGNARQGSSGSDGRGAFTSVSWRAALRVVSEAYIAHGTSTPSRVAISGMRLLQPTRQWVHSLRLLKFAQLNAQMSVPLLLDTAACCATPEAWRKSLKLLERVHEAQPKLLVASIQSLIPENPNAPYALLSQTVRSPAHERVINVLTAVVGSVPPNVLLSNNLCMSFLTHLFSSVESITSNRMESVMQRLSWEQSLALLVKTPLGAEWLQRSASPALLGDTSSRSTTTTAASTIDKKSTSLLAPDGQSQRIVSARLLGSIVRRMPTLEAVQSLLSTQGFGGSVTQHVEVQRATLVVCIRCGHRQEALKILSSLSASVHDGHRDGVGNSGAASSALNFDDEDLSSIGALVVAVHAAKDIDGMVSIVVPALVSLRIRLDPHVLKLVLEDVLRYNSRASNRQVMVPWQAALGWASLLSNTSSTATSIVETGSKHKRLSIPQMCSSDLALYSILVHLCVQGGSAAGALRTVDFMKRVGHATFSVESEMRALLFCMQYGRRHEAQMIVKQAMKRKVRAEAAPLVRLLQRWRWKETQDA